MRQLTIEEVNRIGEAVARELPATAVIDWEYKIGKKSNLLNFRIRSNKDLSKSERKKFENMYFEISKELALKTISKGFSTIDKFHKK
ncbi:MAG: hypothetical protein QXO27_03440 [Candidatus Aenigmatarchaeota archaeon]